MKHIKLFENYSDKENLKQSIQRIITRYEGEIQILHKHRRSDLEIQMYLEYLRNIRKFLQTRNILTEYDKQINQLYSLVNSLVNYPKMDDRFISTLRQIISKKEQLIKRILNDLSKTDQ